MSAPGSLAPALSATGVQVFGRSGVQDNTQTPNTQHLTPSAHPLCTLANSHDEEDADWRSLAVEIYTGQPNADPAAYRHIYESGQLPRKKVWETTQVAYGLRALGLLGGDAVGLGVGCGVEPLLYFLARHTARLYATDLYGFGWVTAPLEMLHDPPRYAPYDYPRERLNVLQMSGMGLVMPDASVDFVYSISTIEHFGGPRNALTHVRNAARILKPGGILAFSTEYVLREGAQGLSPYARDLFTRTMLDWLILNSGLERIGPLDLTPSPELLDDPGVILLPEWTLAQEHFDRLSVSLGGTLFTDVTLFLRKPLT